MLYGISRPHQGNMMTLSNGNIFRISGHLWGESTNHHWIPLTSNTELWCFLWSAPEQTVEQTIECPWFEMPSRSSWHYCNDAEPSPNRLIFGDQLNKDTFIFFQIYAKSNKYYSQTHHTNKQKRVISIRDKPTNIEHYLGTIKVALEET